jgi:hypothetical protein
VHGRHIALAFAILIAIAVAAPAQAATVLYPDLKTLPPRDLRFDRADVSQGQTGDMHNVLRFSNTAWNAGQGPLELRGTIDPITQQGPAVQRVYDSTGGHTDYTVGLFYYHPVHVHYHFDNWGSFGLWTKAAYDQWVASGRTQGSPDIAGAKTTSCITDEEFVKQLVGTPYPQQYPYDQCSPNAQNMLTEGLAVGYGDTYDYYRFEQWIDLGPSGSLADGQYVVRSVVDPLNKVYESAGAADQSREGQQDNEATTTFTVSGGKILDTDPPTGTIRVNDVDAGTQSPNVTVKVLGRDDVSGVDQVRLSNDGSTWSAPTAYSTAGGSATMSMPWNLVTGAGGSSADGTKTVYAQFHDASGKWGPSATDTIVLDRGNNSPYAAAVLTDNPISYWRLGETSGTTAADAMALNPGTYGSAPTLGANSLIPADTANKAVQFDGATEYARVPNSASLGLTANVSLEAWIKPDALPAAGSFASVASKPEAYALQFNGPRLEFTIMQSGTRRRLQAPVGAVVAGQTYHVVGTYDGTTSRLYLNGAEVASMPLTGAITSSGSSLNIASWNTTGEFLKGTIDDVAVFGTPLSAARVKAHYDAGTGGGGPPVPAPDPPSGLGASTVNSGRIDLTWTDNSSNETNFVVERDTSSSFASPTVATVGAGVISYADTGLSPSTTYWYRVKAKNATGSSTYSNVTSATTSAPPVPAAPSLLNAKAMSSSRIDLTWTDNSGVESNMVVERSTSSSFASPVVATLPADTTSYSDTGLSPSTTYYYRVKATNATGPSGYSNTSSDTTQAPPPATTYAQEVTADAPVSYWRLGEASGTVAADARNANPGTFVNGPTLGSASLLGSDTANQAVSFDGVNDHVLVPSSTSLRLGSPLSLEAWIKPTAIPATGSFASLLTKADSYSLQFNGPRLEFTIMQSGVRKRLQAAAGAVVAGQTYHVVGTYDGTTQRLYLNGAQVASVALTGPATANANSLYIASWNGSSEFAKGTIDEAAIYPTALSAARVLAHYNAGK